MPEPSKPEENLIGESQGQVEGYGYSESNHSVPINMAWVDEIGSPRPPPPEKVAMNMAAKTGKSGPSPASKSPTKSLRKKAKGKSTKPAGLEILQLKQQLNKQSRELSGLKSALKARDSQIDHLVKLVEQLVDGKSEKSHETLAKNATAQEEVSKKSKKWRKQKKSFLSFLSWLQLQ